MNILYNNEALLAHTRESISQVFLKYSIGCVFHLFQWISIAKMYFRSLFFNFIYFCREGKGRRKRGREPSMWCVVASLVPPTGDLTWPTTHACALTGNWTSDPLVPILALNPLSHISQGWFLVYTQSHATIISPKRDPSPSRSPHPWPQS